MDELQQMWQALHSLHEQAHGNTAFRTCTTDPCRHLSVDRSLSYQRYDDFPTGLATASLPLLGRDH